ncbi:hypothetical protein AMATHDRAFT_55595, partial [Amanita thiersii Skay4041]
MPPYPQPGASTSSAPPIGVTEFEILKASHKCVRDDGDDPEKEPDRDKTSAKSWDQLLAEKYYASLFREFAVCDLKHFKSGNFALRWRTEDEVLSGAGETTCGNTRCEHHHPTTPAYALDSDSEQPPSNGPPLTKLELPFAYVEHNQQKSALVKVVLCERCVRKLMWKRNKEKKTEMDTEAETERGEEVKAGIPKGKGKSKGEHEEDRSGFGKRSREHDWPKEHYKRPRRDQNEDEYKINDSNKRDKDRRKYRHQHRSPHSRSPPRRHSHPGSGA